jgi:hypothetical protein
MLNRKLTNYLFYGILVIIAGLVFLVRSILIGNMIDNSEAIHNKNIALQEEIAALEAIVDENRDVQTDELFELYATIPNDYSADRLTYKTVAILEELGIDQSLDMQRTVYINHEVSFPAGSPFATVSESYFVVQVEVFFSTNEDGVVTDFIDALYTDEQLFIIRDLNYVTPDGEDFVGVTVHFLAIYDVEVEEES